MTGDNPIPLPEALERYGSMCNVLFHQASHPAEPLDSPDLTRPALMAKYRTARRFYPLVKSYSPTTLNVAFHVRRGDAVEKNLLDRLTSNAIYIDIGKQILAQIAAFNESFPDTPLPPVVFHVFSDGDSVGFDDIVAALPNTRLFINTDLLETIDMLITSDIMVGARSGLSMLCAKIRPPRAITFLPSNVVGRFDSGVLTFNYENGRLVDFGDHLEHYATLRREGKVTDTSNSIEPFFFGDESEPERMIREGVEDGDEEGKDGDEEGVNDEKERKHDDEESENEEKEGKRDEEEGKHDDSKRNDAIDAAESDSIDANDATRDHTEGARGSDSEYDG